MFMKKADTELAAIGAALSVFLCLRLQQRCPKYSWLHSRPPEPLLNVHRSIRATIPLVRLVRVHHVQTDAAPAHCSLINIATL